VNAGEFVWRPIRMRLGISAFGANAYTARAGQRVVEEHSELDGHEELYVVLRGRATFTLGDDEVDAPAGTLVFVRPGTRRGAIATEDGTAVLAVGAKPGAAFEPSPWEDVFAAFSYAEAGNVERGGELIRAAAGRAPGRWQDQYNLACFEVRFGKREAALAAVERGVALDREAFAKAAADDRDLDPIRDDPLFVAALGG